MSLWTKRIVFGDSLSYPSPHAATVCALPGGDLMAAWYAGSHEFASDVVILGAFFRQSTAAWTDPTVLVETEGYTVGNPVLFLANPDDLRLFYSVMYRPLDWGACKLKYRVSNDLGVTFGPRHVLRDETGLMPRNKPCTLSNGDLLLPLYDDRSPRASVCLISGDGGHTWETSLPIRSAPGNEQPTIVELPAGDLLCLMRTEGGGPIWRSRSTNRGRSWSPPRPLSLPNPDAGIDMVWTRRDRLVLAFNNSAHLRSPLSLAVSDDHGETWRVALDIETGPGEYSYPALIQGRDGVLHLLYTNRRFAIAHVTLDEAALDG
ncbi:MAG TPA: sialidase family protein [bacterium]|nr:sialidase family protein [bacterium]